DSRFRGNDAERLLFVIPAFVNPLYFRRFLHFRQNLSTKNNTMQIKTIISFAKIPPPLLI
ncbi:hypothetical protein, partial [Neisseria meningitidis]|uniref:hypothetical protein n=1 Tax=Neisseria meningitidis TaxID=487 RepID=UPI0019567E95